MKLEFLTWEGLLLVDFFSRIDYTSMVIAKPRQLSATAVREDGMYVGHCSTDFLTVTSTTAK